MRLAQARCMNGVAHTLLGAALVVVGMIAAALADRIRNIHLVRERSTESMPSPIDVVSDRAPKQKSERGRAHPETKQQDADDVVAALVAVGHKKQIATAAVFDCNARERTTMEGWTRAALRRCLREGLT